MRTNPLRAPLILGELPSRLNTHVLQGLQPPLTPLFLSKCCNTAATSQDFVRKGLAGEGTAFDRPEELTEKVQDPPDDVATRIRKALGDYIRPFPVPAVEDLPAPDVGDLPGPLRLEDAVYASLDSNFREIGRGAGATADVESELGYNFIHLEERCTAPSDLFIQCREHRLLAIRPSTCRNQEADRLTTDDALGAGVSPLPPAQTDAWLGTTPDDVRGVIIRNTPAESPHDSVSLGGYTPLNDKVSLPPHSTDTVAILVYSPPLPSSNHPKAPLPHLCIPHS